MSFIQHIKHAPRWTWYSAAGVSAGVVGIRLWKHRAAPPATQGAGDGSTPGDSGGIVPATTGGGGGGVIVPPVIQSSDGSVADTTGAIAGMFGGAFSDLIGLVGVVVTGDQQVIGQLVTANTQVSDDAIVLMGGAGGAPVPVNNGGLPPVQIVLPPPPPPASSTPVVVGQSGQPTTQGRSCSDLFGFAAPHHNPANGAPSRKSCYYNHCERVNGTKKNVHIYANGDRQGSGGCGQHGVGDAW